MVEVARRGGGWGWGDCPCRLSMSPYSSLCACFHNSARERYAQNSEPGSSTLYLSTPVPKYNLY